MGISDDFQHSRGQKDGANGKPFGDFNRKYRQGYDAGRFDHDKKKYGETIARGAKAERDFAKRISEGKKPGKSRKETARTEESFSYPDRHWDHDRHYHGSDYDFSISIPNWMKWAIGLGVSCVLLIGLQSYTGKSQEKLGVEVARKYNLNERGLVKKSLDFSWMWSSESSEHYRTEIALYRLKNHKKEITPKLKENLIRLKKLKESKKKEIRFNDFTQFENNIWVAGESSSDGACFGYMWHSPDCGNTWFWQLRIGPWLQKYNFGGTPDVPFGVHFFDSKEGWSFTQNIIFHTTDGGRKWNQSYKHNIGKLKKLYIIDKQNLVAMRKIPAVIKTNKRIIHSYWGGVKTQMEYTLDGGRTWKSHPEWKPEILGLEAKLIEDSSIKLESPYP